MARTAARQVTRYKSHAIKVDKAQFAERLKTLMQERGLTIAETARRVRKHLAEGEGFDDTNLIHYRQGRSIPRPGHLEALSRALGIRASELVGGEARRQLVPVERESPPTARTETAELKIFRSAASGAGPRSPIQAIEDHGEKVLIRFEQLVPWSVALQILHALKDSGLGELAPS